MSYPRESIMNNDDGSSFEPMIEGCIGGMIERKLTKLALLEVEDCLPGESRHIFPDLDIEGIEVVHSEGSEVDACSDEDELDPDVERHIGQTIERKLTQRSLLLASQQESKDGQTMPNGLTPTPGDQYQMTKTQIVGRIAASMEEIGRAHV